MMVKNIIITTKTTKNKTRKNGIKTKVDEENRKISGMFKKRIKRKN